MKTPLNLTTQYAIETRVVRVGAPLDLQPGEYVINAVPYENDIGSIDGSPSRVRVFILGMVR